MNNLSVVDLVIFLLTGVCFVMMSTGCKQAPSEERLLRLPYHSDVTNDNREFFVYLPQGYDDDPQKNWPVIFFLHGGGERGNGRDDLGYVMFHGPLMEAWIQRRPLPFVIISPQLPAFGMEDQVALRGDKAKPERLPEGTPPRSPVSKPSFPIVREDADAFFSGSHERYAPYPDETELPNGWFRVQDDLIKMLKQVLQEYRADVDRVYLTGLSYGGFGTFDLAANHPEHWAAIAPIVGTGNPGDAKVLAEAEIPIWMFTGGKDTVVNPHWMYRIAQALQEAGHPSLRFTVHEDMGHDAWKRVYAGQDIYDWFLQHRRGE